MRLWPALNDRRRQCLGFGGKSMASGGPVAAAGHARALPKKAIYCQRDRLEQISMLFSPPAQGRTPATLGAQTRKARRPRNPPATSPSSRALGRKPGGGKWWDRLAKGRHRHSAIVVRSRRYRNARDGLLEDGATSDSRKISGASGSDQESLVEALLEGMGEGFFAFDHSWRLTASNSAAEAILGAPSAEVVGKLLSNLLPQIRGTEFERRCRVVIEKGTREEFEIHSALRPHRHHEVRAFPFGADVGVAFRDITGSRERYAGPP